MSSNHDQQTAMPIKHDLTLLYAISSLIVLLVATVSVAGLLYRSTIYPTEELLRAFVPNDMVNLLIGLPILISSMWLSWHGKWLGLLCWPGALFFVLYNYIIYVFASRLNWTFLFYLALVMLSVYSLISFVACLDRKVVQQRLSGSVPEKFAGGVFAGLGLLFFLRSIGVIVSALITETLIADTELATNTSDFFITPAWVIGGILLWQRKALGYVAGLGLLFQASMLFIALIICLLLTPCLTTAPFAIADVIVVFAMGLICFISFALFARGVVAKRV